MGADMAVQLPIAAAAPPAEAAGGGVEGQPGASIVREKGFEVREGERGMRVTSQKFGRKE